MNNERFSASMLLNFGKAKTEPIALVEFIQCHDVMIIQVPKRQPKRGSFRLVANSIHSLWVCKHLRGWVDHQQLELIERGINMMDLRKKYVRAQCWTGSKTCVEPPCHVF